MENPTPEGIPHAIGTRVKLLTSVHGAKKINGQWVDHSLSAGTIVSIAKHTGTRTSINTDPLSPEHFTYKLETELVENVPQEELEGPYIGYNDAQKISHTALDTARCHPTGRRGMYKIGQMPCIRSGRQYTYSIGSQSVTLKGGDTVRIAAQPTTKSGSTSVMIPENAYYLQVQKVQRFMAPMNVTWQTKFYVPTACFEVIQD